MKPPASRFQNLAQALRDRTATVAGEPAALGSPGATHRPAAALGAMAEGLRERIGRLEAELARASTTNAALEEQLARTRGLAERAGASEEEFLFLDPGLIRDPLPHDRLPGAFEGPEFEALLADIRANGQNDAITVRVAGEGGFEIAAGRRRLEACRQLGLQVLSRVRPLDDAAMLRVQFSENERREDISALERARWFAQVRARLDLQSREIAAQFGLDPSTLSLYLRLSRFPEEIIRRLKEPRRLAMLRARRVMEAVEADEAVLPRILSALDAQMQDAGGDRGLIDGEEQIALLMRAAEGRGPAASGRAALPERRHIVHKGQRLGTLTRNGGQWVFRFATALPDETVQSLIDRLPELMAREPSSKS
ncbi:ParB/RepB/Spo0J family partition protein [Pseudoroseomonas sp. WGS1072]|uniref:ParB/RepB/Spo0J family partition protein n=1 Tax=Roseomonas sp. WGS1072 TaxID=3366816 RepID=UPI003BF34EE9